MTNLFHPPANESTQVIPQKTEYDNGEVVQTPDMITWDHETWKQAFYHSAHPDYHFLRQQVWLNTLAIVKTGGYTTSENHDHEILKVSAPSRFYSKYFEAAVTKPFSQPPQITVVNVDCLDIARSWRKQGLEVSVLNMASRRNPGGGVRTGAGAQEEYLFRCSNYFQALYPFAEYASQYGLERAPDQYPLDRDFGGIFSSGITIFRANEASGYALLEEPWKVNFIAAAGMNRPALIYDNGESRIDPSLVSGVKNKIRTIFRIAVDNNQRNLVLGALGCGAFKNPPRHTAQLFRDVLCEPEFEGAFQQICFAVKQDHNSNGNSNYDAFYRELNGFIPITGMRSTNIHSPAVKISCARNVRGILTADGSVYVADDDTEYRLPHVHCAMDVAGGFHPLYVLERKNTLCSYKNKQDSSFGCIYGFCGMEAVKHARAVYATEAHYAILSQDGTVQAWDEASWETIPYRQIMESWQNIKQLALTFDEGFGLTADGQILCTKSNIEKSLREYYDADNPPVQIAASGLYYCTHWLAVLHQDGTLQLFDVLNECSLAETLYGWQDVEKLACGSAFAAGLTADGRIRLPPDLKFISGAGPIADLDICLYDLYAVNTQGKIFHVDYR